MVLADSDGQPALPIQSIDCSDAPMWKLIGMSQVLADLPQRVPVIVAEVGQLLPSWPLWRCGSELMLMPVRPIVMGSGEFP